MKILFKIILLFTLALGTAPFVILSTPGIAKTKLIDVNSASQKELESLEGIGAARAKAIVKNRPYKSTDLIVSKAGIPRPVYEAIKGKIVAR